MKKFIKISLYHPNDQNEIRRTYKGYFQPLSHKFPQMNIGEVFLDLIIHG